jgi:transmembrane sensor
VIRALGTQFNVYRQEASIRVAVIEGAIRVSTPHESSQLVAAPERKSGQEARVTEGGRITEKRSLEVVRVAAWRQHRLMFHADTLADIAAEFNRYNERPRIRVEGDEVRARRFTGVFNADDPRALVKFLGSYGDLVLEELGDELVVHRR